MPNPYKQILAAIDCSEESIQVLSRAVALAREPGAALHLIHVIEPLALAYGADVPMDVSDLQSSLVTQARDSALEYARRYEVPEAHVHVELGSIEKTIQEAAERLHSDLIVVGSHTRTGLALLLGSTAKGLVPGANCDVLAVKIHKAD